MTSRIADRAQPGPIPPSSLDPAALLRAATAEHLTRSAGSCRRPLRLAKTSSTLTRATGQIRALDTTVIHARCGNRRESRCPSCSTLYKYDTYNLIAAGLRGGKQTPDTVAEHPRLFLTLTAPSFGPVHLGPAKNGQFRPCHPRRAGQGPDCRTWHRESDPLIGTPLDPASYDYAGHVLFNALAGKLWSRFTIDLRRHLATAADIPRDRLRQEITLSYAKVAEYQTRGIVHYHAVIRLDGPDGATSPPPSWATPAVLDGAIRQAAATALVTTPEAQGIPSRTLRFGAQIDVKTLSADEPSGTDRGLTEAAVARYIAKYAAKSTETTGVELQPLACRACHGTGAQLIELPTGESVTRFCDACHGHGRDQTAWADLDAAGVTAHARRLVETCWLLGGVPGLAALRLRAWAHLLGFRGHTSTRSRRYSTTLAALRAERAEYQAAVNSASPAAEFGGETTLVVNTWHYLGRADTARADGSPPTPPIAVGGPR
jgi:uncharacterized Zn-finger protein